jgi:phage-related protein
MNLEALLIPISLDTEGMKSSVDKVKGLASGIGGAIGNVASVGFGAAAAGVTAIGAACVGGIAAVQNWGSEIDSIGDVIGTTSEESSGLAVMMKTIGGNTEDLTKQLAFMGKGLLDGTGGLGKTGEALKDLGINVQNADGSMRSATDIFGDAATVFSTMPDGIEKTTLMMQIFGKSGQDMSDTMNAAANGGMQNYIDKAKTLGLSLSDDATNASIEFGKSLETVKMLGQGLFVTIGNNLLPILAPLLEKFTNFAMSVMPQVSSAISTAAGWLNSIINLISLVVTGDFHGGIFGLDEDAPFLEFFYNLHDTLVNQIIPAIQQFGDWVTTVAVPAVIQFVQPILAQLIPGLIQLAKWIGDIAGFLLPLLQTAIKYVSDNWDIFKYIIAAVGIAILALTSPVTLIIGAIVLLATAWANNWGGIQEKTKVVTDWIKEKIKLFVDTIKKWWSEHGESIKKTAQAMWDAVVAIFNTFKTTISNIFSLFKLAFSGDWKGFGEKLREMWDDAWENIKKLASAAWEFLKTEIPKLIDKITGFFKNTDWKKIGKDIVEGIGNGVTSMISWIKEKALALAKAVADTITGFFHMESPSKLTFDMGVNVSKGFINGMIDEYDRGVRKFSPAINMDVKAMGNSKSAPDNSGLITALGNIKSNAEFDYGKFGRAVRDAVLMATG